MLFHRRRRTTPRRGAKETIQADAPALGLALLAAGAGVWLAVASHTEAKAIGTGLLVLGVLVLTSRWFGFPIPALRPEQPVHEPPGGGGAPLMPSLDYQVAQLRQVVAEIAESAEWFDSLVIESVLLKEGRRGVKAKFEPLHAPSCDKGLAKLVELGELKCLGDHPELGPWEIVKKR